MISNDEIASRFELIADFLEATDDEYRPRVYRRAAENIRDYPGSIATIAENRPDELREIDGVGDAIAAKIVEYCETGEIQELSDLREELPVDMASLTRVEGVGPKTVATLYEALDVRNLDDLEAAAAANQIRSVSGFGETSEANIQAGIDFAREATSRHLLNTAREIATDAIKHLETSSDVHRIEPAGSVRRWRETVGDIDILVAAAAAAPVLETFTDWSQVEEVIEAGQQKASVRASGIRVDCRVVDPSEFGAALQYFTGSRDHNVTVRNVAIERELKLNEYGVFDISSVDADDDQRAGKRIAGETETGVYAALGMATPPPEIRRDSGEVEAAKTDSLPELIEPDDYNGDLHVHTVQSDGNGSLQAMISAAEAASDEFIAICDHGTGPGILPDVGLSPAALREQADAIDAARGQTELSILHGVEANIAADGTVHPDDPVLAELDLVVAAPHSALDQDAASATDRLIAAIEHSAVDVIGHPSGRLLNQREGLALEVDRLADAAASEDTALEINANPHRLDLWGDAVQTAIDVGAPIAVNTDAHAQTELHHRTYGIHVARRGWASSEDVLNAGPIGDLRRFMSP